MQPPPFGPPPPPSPPGSPPWPPPPGGQGYVAYPPQPGYPPAPAAPSPYAGSPYGAAGHPYAGYPGMAVPSAPNEGKATLSLVLGIISLATMFCYLGFLLGLPAVILGVLSRREISRSNGALGGKGLATGGIVCGAIGATMNVLQIGAFVALSVFAMSAAPTAPTTYPTYSPPVPLPMEEPADSQEYPSASAPPAFGSLHVEELIASQGPLKTQLTKAATVAAARHRGLVVFTTAAWCKECREIESAMKDPAVATALADADVARIDVDDFKGQLAAIGMEKPVLPYFFYFDSTSLTKPLRAASADQWTDNTPANIAAALHKLVTNTGGPTSPHSSAPSSPMPVPAPSTKGTAL